MRAVALVALAACGGRAPARIEEPDPPVRTDMAPPPDDGALVFPECPTATLAPSDPDDVLATVERTACFGFCPVYEVVVYRSGLVEYKGQSNVLRCDGTAQLGPEELKSLRGLFVDARYMALADAYTSYDATDGPTIYTSYSPRPGVSKRIEHYTGDAHVPEVLEALEDQFAQIINIEQFIGSERDRTRAWHHHK